MVLNNALPFREGG